MSTLTLASWEQGLLALAGEAGLVQGPFYGARILLVDRAFEGRSNHALSFWTAGTTPYEPVVAHTWRRLKVAGPDFEKEAPLGDLHYQTMGAVDFRRFATDALDAMPAVTRLQGAVSHIEDGAEWATARLTLSLALPGARRDDDRTLRAGLRGAGLREAGRSLMGGATEGQ
jgi:hypothetical protein